MTAPKGSSALRARSGVPAGGSSGPSGLGAAARSPSALLLAGASGSSSAARSW